MRIVIIDSAAVYASPQGFSIFCHKNRINTHIQPECALKRISSVPIHFLNRITFEINVIGKPVESNSESTSLPPVLITHFLLHFRSEITLRSSTKYY